MKKILFLIAVGAVPFLFSGCGGKNQSNQAEPKKTIDQPAGQNSDTGATPDQTSAQSGEVPQPQGEDVVRTFVNLINEKRIPEAVAMLDASTAPNETDKQAWGVQFDVFESISVKSIEPFSEAEWTAEQQEYKVVLTASLKPGSEKAVIPNYGWENGDNIRWIILKKDGSGQWKILGIGTGP